MPLDAPHAPVLLLDGWIENLVQLNVLPDILCSIHLFGADYGVFDVSRWSISVGSTVDVELVVQGQSF